MGQKWNSSVDPIFSHFESYLLFILRENFKRPRNNCFILLTDSISRFIYLRYFAYGYSTFTAVKIHKIKAISGTQVQLPCVTPHKEYEILTWYRNDTQLPVARKQKIYTHVKTTFILL